VGGRLRVLLYAERYRAFDEKSLVTHVAPAERERFAWTQSCVRKDANECCVPRVGGGAHRLNDDGGERPNLGLMWERRTADGTDRIRLDVLRLDCPLEDRAEQLEGFADRDGPLPMASLSACRRATTSGVISRSVSGPSSDRRCLS
jgi:hypothetical protein